MPIHVETLEPGSLLYYRFSGSISLDDLEHLPAEEDPLYAVLPDQAAVGAIADLSGVDTIAARLFARLQQIRFLRDDRVIVVVVVGANPYLRALTISLGIMSGQREFLFRQSLADALHLLASYPALHPDD